MGIETVNFLMHADDHLLMSPNPDRRTTKISLEVNDVIIWTVSKVAAPESDIASTQK